MALEKWEKICVHGPSYLKSGLAHDYVAIQWYYCPNDGYVWNFLGCYETPTASVQRDISNEMYPTFAWYLFCARFQIYLSMGISVSNEDNAQSHAI